MRTWTVSLPPEKFSRPLHTRAVLGEPSGLEAAGSVWLGESMRDLCADMRKPAGILADGPRKTGFRMRQERGLMRAVSPWT